MVIPISLLLILLLLYFQFRTVTASFIHFSGVFVAFAGGFIMLWLYGQGWFLNFSVAGINLRDMFQMHTINLSVAVWVGFIALFGIATNDGVIMGTYIHQVFEERHPATVHDVREAVVSAGHKRVRPAMMTTAVAVIALIARAYFDRKRRRYYDTDGNSHFWRNGYPGNDNFCSTCFSGYVEGSMQ